MFFITMVLLMGAIVFLLTAVLRKFGQMDKVFFLVLGLFLGIVLCSSLYVIVFGWGNVVYTTKKNVQLENGVTIPKNTELVKFKSFHEGYDILSLYVGVSREDIDAVFKKESRKGIGLIIPHWVGEEDSKK